MTTIYVGNLPADAQAETLRNIFSRYGRVTAIELIRDRKRSRRRSRSYGLIDMPGKAEARTAVDELNGQYFRGLFLRVHPARTASETDA